MVHLDFLTLVWTGRGFRTALSLIYISKQYDNKCRTKQMTVEVAEVADIPNGLVKDALQIPLRESRAFEVLVSADLLRADKSLVI